MVISFKSWSKVEYHFVCFACYQEVFFFVFFFFGGGALLVQPTSYFAMSFSNVTHDMAVGYSVRLLLVITSARPPCDVDAWQNVRRQ